MAPNSLFDKDRDRQTALERNLRRNRRNSLYCFVCLLFLSISPIFFFFLSPGVCASRGVCKRSSCNSQRLLSQVSPHSPHSRRGSPRAPLHFPRGSEVHCAPPEAQQESSELCSKHSAGQASEPGGHDSEADPEEQEQCDGMVKEFSVKLRLKGVARWLRCKVRSVYALC